MWPSWFVPPVAPLSPSGGGGGTPEAMGSRHAHVARGREEAGARSCWSRAYPRGFLPGVNEPGGRKLPDPFPSKEMMILAEVGSEATAIGMWGEGEGGGNA